MSLPTINMQEAIDQFHQLMQPDCEFRVLRLLGEAKLGKSHLVTKLFPHLGQTIYQARYAVLDLRNPAQDIADILHAACNWLGGMINFPTYAAAHRDWLNRPIIQVSGLQALLSRIQVKAPEETDESHKMARHLTTQFVADLRQLTIAPVLLIFDQLDDANPANQDWLIDTLLVQLAPLTHVRVVVAGRTMPEASGSYAAICCSYELLPVHEDQAYINYCRECKIELAENEIRVLARAVDYKPGAFADVMPKFMRREAAHG